MFQFDGNVYCHHMSPIARKHSLIAGGSMQWPVSVSTRNTNQTFRNVGSLEGETHTYLSIILSHIESHSLYLHISAFFSQTLRCAFTHDHTLVTFSPFILSVMHPVKYKDKLKLTFSMNHLHTFPQQTGYSRIDRHLLYL